MNRFDRMIENFSATALGTRVRAVVFLGLLLVVLAAAAGSWFLTGMHALTTEAVGHRLDEGGAELVVAPDDLVLIAQRPQHTAYLLQQKGAALPVTITTRSVDPGEERLHAAIDGLPAGTTLPEHFRLRIVLEEKPYWRLLWGSRDVDDPPAER